jgi:flagellar hook assembly protein FlgD
VPNSYTLLQNYPNPFNPSTTLSFRMPEAAQVTLTIYNVLGQPVRTVFSGELPAGTHSMVWDGQLDNGAVAQSGIYFYRLQAPNWTDAKKMTLLK